MKEFIEKLIGRLEEAKQNHKPRVNGKTTMRDITVYKTAMGYTIEIVNQLAEEYKHCTLCYIQSPCEYQNENAMLPNELLADKSGWIPVEQQLPESGVSVIVSYKDRFLSQADGTCEGWYDATNMIWHLTDYEYSDNVEVIAWRERLTPYQPEGE